MTNSIKLTRPQVRVMLDFLGVPFNQQGKTVADSKAILHTYEVAAPEEFKTAYDLIVLHKAPSNESAKNISYHDMGKFVAEHMGTQENKAVAHIRNFSEQKINEAYAENLKMAKIAIDAAAENYRPIKVNIGDKASVVIKGVVPEEFPRLLKLAQQRKNIMMVGPAGCGKTFIASKIAEALGLDFSSQSCSAGISESLLSGWLLPTEKGGQFAYVQSEFVRIYENGGVFLLDEMDAADPNVLVFINSALANGSFTTPQRFNKPLVTKHKDFVAVAATNTFGGGADAMYHARNALDAATLDRFRIGMIGMDYSPIVEASLVDAEILAWGKNVRSKIKETGLNKIMSTRFLKDASDMKQGQDWSMKDVKESYYADFSREELAVMRGA